MHLKNGEKTESVTQTTNVSKLRNELQCSYSHVNHIVWRTQIICYRHYKAKKIISEQQPLNVHAQDVNARTHMNQLDQWFNHWQIIQDFWTLCLVTLSYFLLLIACLCHRSWDWQKMKHQKSHKGVGGFIVFTVWLWDTRRSKLELQIKNTRKPLIGDFFIKVTHTHRINMSN